LKIDAIIKGYEFARAHKDSGGLVGFLFGVTEAADCMVLLRIIKLFPKEYSYLGGMTIAKLFVSFIPRSIWPDKPQGINVIIANIIGHSGKTSMGTTIYGEFYANFGVLAVLFIPIAMIAVQRIVIWSARESGLVIPIGVVSGFTLTRMAFSDTIMTFLMIGLIIHGYSLLNDRRGETLSFSDEPAGDPIGAR
jgi:hypothetical protein